MKNLFSKNLIAGLLLTSSLFVSGAAFAGAQKPAEPANPQVDLTTTGSTEPAKDCLLIKSADTAESVCAKADMFPSIGLSGLNLN